MKITRVPVVASDRWETFLPVTPEERIEALLLENAQLKAEVLRLQRYEPPVGAVRKSLW